jgi:hypothetical protein
MTTTYEWIVEHLDGEPAGDPDILEVCHYDTYREAALETGVRTMLKRKKNYRVALVREVGNDVEGLTERMWAYVVDGELPEYFEIATDMITSVRVPKRYHVEVERGA